MKYFLLLIPVLIFISFHATFLYSGEFITRQKKFIVKLYDEKRYFDAVAETRRLMAYSHDPLQNRKYEYFILGNYYRGEQYRTVIYNLNRKKEKLNRRETLLLSRSYLKAGLFDESYLTMIKLDYGSHPGNNYGLLLGEIEPLVHLERYETALNRLNEAQPHIPSGKYIVLRKQLLKHRDLTIKYPWLSGTLSAVVPGAGQIYSGKYSAGIISFLGVAAAAAGAWYYNEKGNREMTYSLAFFTCLFYTGNIYSGYNSALGRNRDEERNYLNGLNKTFFNRYQPLEPGDVKRIFNE